jgi:hypothetical protein
MKAGCLNVCLVFRAHDDEGGNNGRDGRQS